MARRFLSASVVYNQWRDCFRSKSQEYSFTMMNMKFQSFRTLCGYWVIFVVVGTGYLSVCGRVVHSYFNQNRGYKKVLVPQNLIVFERGHDLA